MIQHSIFNLSTFRIRAARTPFTHSFHFSSSGSIYFCFPTELGTFCWALEREMNKDKRYHQMGSAARTSSFVTKEMEASGIIRDMNKHNYESLLMLTSERLRFLIEST